MSLCKTLSSGYDAIGLRKMVKDVAHNQTEAKQTVTGFVESTPELFSYHQGENVRGNNYMIIFNASVESIKSNGGKPWHRPGLAKIYTKKIAVDMTRAEGFTAATLPKSCGGELLEITRKN